MQLAETLEHQQPLDLSVGLAQTTDLNGKWSIIHGTFPGEPARRRDAHDSSQLLDFAASRNCPSRYLRLYALDQAYQGLVRAQSRGEVLPTELQIAVSNIQSVLPPSHSSVNIRKALSWPRGGPWDLEEDAGVNYDKYSLAYHGFFVRQANKEGVEVCRVTPKLDTDEVCDAIPVTAGMFLQSVVGVAPGKLDCLSPTMADEALDLLLDFKASDFSDRVSVFCETAKLARYTGEAGIKHDVPVEFLHNLPMPERLEYARILNELYDATAKLRDFYPPEFADSVVAGQRILIANALFALADHIQSGMKTDDSLHLLHKGEVTVKFSGDQPIRLLEKFAQKITRAHKRITSPTTERRLVVESKDFSIIDFVDPADDDPLMVMLNIRPEPGKSCNYRYEYGSRRLGVEATIDWRFDEGATDPVRPYHKKSRTSEAFSLRTDREGRPPEDVGAVRDPLSDIGTISFDSGSIFADSFGGDLARLLARGNRLRGHSHQNHMTDTMDQSLGKREVFAGIARTMLSQLLEC